MEYLENKLINSLLIILAFWIGSYLVTFLMSLLEKFATKTKTTLDDKILHAAKLPIRYLSVLLGFYLAAIYYGFDWSWNGINVESIFLSFVIILIGFTASRLLKTFIVWYMEKETIKKSNQTMFIFIRKVISVFVYSIVLLLVLQHLGVQIGPLLAGMGVAGIAIALGLQETLANLFAALFLVMDKSINVGDWIELEDGTKAYIEDISWRSVRIRTKTGNSVIVPNSNFVGQRIASYDYPESSFDMKLSLGVDYSSDLDKVESVAIRAARKIMEAEGLKTEKNNPRVRFKEFADSSINFIIRLRIEKAFDESRIKHTLIKEIAREFRKEGIEIPFPQRVVEIKK